MRRPHQHQPLLLLSANQSAVCVCVRATVQFQLSRGFGESDGRKSKDEDRAPRIEYGKCAVQWRWNIDTGNETSSRKPKPAESSALLAGMSLARASGLRGFLFSLCVPVKHTPDCVCDSTDTHTSSCGDARPHCRCGGAASSLLLLLLTSSICPSAELLLLLLLGNENENEPSLAGY